MLHCLSAVRGWRECTAQAKCNLWLPSYLLCKSYQIKQMKLAEYLQYKWKFHMNHSKYAPCGAIIFPMLLTVKVYGVQYPHAPIKVKFGLQEWTTGQRRKLKKPLNSEIYENWKPTEFWNLWVPYPKPCTNAPNGGIWHIRVDVCFALPYEISLWLFHCVAPMPQETGNLTASSNSPFCGDTS